MSSVGDHLLHITVYTTTLLYLTTLVGKVNVWLIWISPLPIAEIIADERELLHNLKQSPLGL